MAKCGSGIPGNGKVSGICCIPELLVRKLHCGAPQAAREVEQVKLCCLTEYSAGELGLRAQWEAVIGTGQS